MKPRSFLTLAGLLIFSGISFYVSPASRQFWIGITFLSFVGIFIFDGYSQIIKNGANTFLFLITYGLVLKAILEPEAELFWRDCAGIVFITALAFEQNGKSWFGTGSLKSSIGPAILFFILILAGCLPVLTPEQSLMCTLLAVLIFCFLEIFYILRSQTESHSGSFMAAMRSASSGIICLYYSTTFLPGISSEKPFIYFQVILPLIGLAIALFGAFFEEIKKRYILFCAGWSLFIFWAELSGEPLKIYAAVGATISGAWAIMMTNKRNSSSSDGREVFLKLSGWGIPGSILFSFILLTLLHSESVLAQRGSVIWLLSFFVYWAGLTWAKWDDAKMNEDSWTWRNSLALSVTIAGGGLLAGAKVFPSLVSALLGVGK